MADAGFRLNVEGEKEFKAALQEIDAQLKINKSEIKLLTEEYKMNDTGIDSLVSTQKVLTDTISLQGAKFETLNELYKKTADKYGETNVLALNLKKSMMEASVAIAKNTAEYETNNKVLEEQRAALAESQKAFELTGYNTDELGEALAELDASLKANAAELKAVAAQYDNGAKKSKDFAAKEAELKKQNEILNNSIADQEKKIELLNAKMEIAADRYGEQSKEVSEYREQIADATGELQDMTEQVEKNAKALEDNGKNSLDLTSIFKNLSDVTGVKIPDSVSKLAESFSSGTASSVLAGGIMTGAVAGITKSLTDATSKVMDFSHEIIVNAAQMGITTDEYQQLEYIALKTGVGVETMANAFNQVNNQAGEAYKTQEEYNKAVKKLDDELYEAQQELNSEFFYEGWKADLAEQADSLNELENLINDYVEEYNKARNELSKINEDAKDDLEDQLNEEKEIWRKLGVSIYDETGENLRPTIDIFYDLIDSFGKVTNSTERAKIMMDMLGESANQLNPLVSTGSDLLRNYAEEAYATGYVIDNELVQSYNNAKYRIELFNEGLSRSGTLLLDSVLALFGGDFDRVGESIKNAWKSFTGSFKSLTGSAYATGTYNHPGGYAVVGEKGPELVELPTGSKVYPNGTYPASMGGGTTVYNITIDANSVREFNDIVRIAQSERQSIRMGYVGG